MASACWNRVLLDLGTARALPAVWSCQGSAGKELSGSMLCAGLDPGTSNLAGSGPSCVLHYVLSSICLARSVPAAHLPQLLPGGSHPASCSRHKAALQPWLGLPQGRIQMGGPGVLGAAGQWFLPGGSWGLVARCHVPGGAQSSSAPQGNAACPPTQRPECRQHPHSAQPGVGGRTHGGFAGLQRSREGQGLGRGLPCLLRAPGVSSCAPGPGEARQELT